MKKLLEYIPESALYSYRRLRFMVSQRELYQRFKKLRAGVTEDGYSLKPFDDRKCIFIHIPKCAGQSIRNTLFENLLPGHINIYTYQMVFPKVTFERYFKFTFVRNPWDRLVSAYLFMKAGGAHEIDNEWAMKYLSDFPDFESFIHNGLAREEILNWPHFRPQVNFLRGQNGEIRIDFIGRVENIQKDIEIVKERLGIDRKLLLLKLYLIYTRKILILLDMNFELHP